MAFMRERILELIHLERRRSSARRVLSVAGLLLGGGLVGAVVMLLMRPRQAAAPAERLSAADRNGYDAIGSAAFTTPIHDGPEMPLMDGPANHD